jgi:hypothetical protein
MGSGSFFFKYQANRIIKSGRKWGNNFWSFCRRILLYIIKRWQWDNYLNHLSRQESHPFVSRPIGRVQLRWNLLSHCGLRMQARTRDVSTSNRCRLQRGERKREHQNNSLSCLGRSIGRASASLIEKKRGSIPRQDTLALLLRRQYKFPQSGINKGNIYVFFHFLSVKSWASCWRRSSAVTSPAEWLYVLIVLRVATSRSLIQRANQLRHAGPQKTKKAKVSGAKL